METKQILLTLLILWVLYSLLFSREGFFVGKYDCSKNFTGFQCNNNAKEGCSINTYYTPDKLASLMSPPVDLCICNDPEKCTDKRGTVRTGSTKDYIKDKLKEMQQVENEYVSLKDKTDTEAMNKKKELETKYGVLMTELSRWKNKK